MEADALTSEPPLKTICSVHHVKSGWMKHKLESGLLGEISITLDMQMTPPYGRKQRGTKEPLDEGKRGEWKKLA